MLGNIALRKVQLSLSPALDSFRIPATESEGRLINIRVSQLLVYYMTFRHQEIYVPGMHICPLFFNQRLLLSNKI